MSKIDVIDVKLGKDAAMRDRLQAGRPCIGLLPHFPPYPLPPRSLPLFRSIILSGRHWRVRDRDMSGDA